MEGGAVTSRFGFVILVWLSLSLIAWSAAYAQSPLAADLDQRLQAAIALSESNQQQTLRIAAGLGNAALLRTYRKNAQRDADTAISSVVVSEITRHPQLASIILARASELAPGSRGTLVNVVQAAFPSFAIRGRNNISFLGVPATASRPITALPPVYEQSRTTLLPSQPIFAMPTRIMASEQSAVTAYDGAIAGSPEEIRDPVVSFNRAIFAFNNAIDTYTLRPVAALYNYATPEVARIAVRRAIRNLNAPVVIVNDLLQLDPIGAGITTGRYLINSTAGILGLFDVAELIGLEEHQSDFGETLFSYGLGPGPYVVLPILGPSTARDATGRLVDTLIDPLTYLLQGSSAIGFAAGHGLVRREEVFDSLEELRATSFDYYASLRSAHYKNRAIQLGIQGSGSK